MTIHDSRAKTLNSSFAKAASAKLCPRQLHLIHSDILCYTSVSTQLLNYRILQLISVQCIQLVGYLLLQHPSAQSLAHPFNLKHLKNPALFPLCLSHNVPSSAHHASQGSSDMSTLLLPPVLYTTSYCYYHHDCYIIPNCYTSILTSAEFLTHDHLGATTNYHYHQQLLPSVMTTIIIVTSSPLYTGLLRHEHHRALHAPHHRHPLQHNPLHLPIQHR